MKLEACAEMAVAPGVLVTIMVPVAWVCPKGMVRAEFTAATEGTEEKRKTVIFPVGALAGRPDQS